MTNTPISTRPPETLEGWFALHTVARFDRRFWRSLPAAERADIMAEAAKVLGAPAEGGWSATIALVGSTSDILFLHLRPTLAQITAVGESIANLRLSDYLTPTFVFLSVTEAALYSLSVKLGEKALVRGGAVGDSSYREELAQYTASELDSPHMQRRLYPELPTDMPWVCFYPMSKRRQAANNWYTLPLAERDRLMVQHGLTGRRFAGRIRQIVTGSIGFDEWEWGVTLFAKDPLDIKRIVTEMRYEPSSSEYAEFGDFYVGRLRSPSDGVGWLFGEEGRGEREEG